MLKSIPRKSIKKRNQDKSVKSPKTKFSKPPSIKSVSVKPPSVKSVSVKSVSVKPISEKLLKQISKDPVFLRFIKEKNIKVTKFKGSGYDTLFGLVYLITENIIMLVYHYIPSNMDVMQDIFEISSIAWRYSNQFLPRTSEQSGDIKNYEIFYPVTNDLREAVH